jgi:hypothetical protein
MEFAAGVPRLCRFRHAPGVAAAWARSAEIVRRAILDRAGFRCRWGDGPVSPSGHERTSVKSTGCRLSGDLARREQRSGRRGRSDSSKRYCYGRVQRMLGLRPGLQGIATTPSGTRVGPLAGCSRAASARILMAEPAVAVNQWIAACVRIASASSPSGWHDLSVPGSRPTGGVVEGVGESLRRLRVDRAVGSVVVLVVLKGLECGPILAGQRREHVVVVGWWRPRLGDVRADDRFGRDAAQFARDNRAPIVAGRAVVAVSEARHQHRPGLRDTLGSPPRVRCRTGEPGSRQ